jgi:hypothetical protein
MIIVRQITQLLHRIPWHIEYEHRIEHNRYFYICELKELVQRSTFSFVRKVKLSLCHVSCIWYKRVGFTVLLQLAVFICQQNSDAAE